MVRLRASAASCAVSTFLGTPAVHGWYCVLQAEAVARGAVACGGGFASGEPRGGCACRKCDQLSWGSVAGTESPMDDAADIAEAQLYACVHGRQLRCKRMCANAGCALMILRVAGLGGCARGCSVWWGVCELRAEGRRCVQTIALEMMGRGRWHRVSEGWLS